MLRPNCGVAVIYLDYILFLFRSQEKVIRLTAKNMVDKLKSRWYTHFIINLTAKPLMEK